MIEIQKKLLDVMLKIRSAEEKIVEVYAKDRQMRTPTHLSIGQEAVAAALGVALQADDQLFAGHRCHAAYLAKGGDFQGFFDELCGRQSGIAHGRAGSAHLTDVSVGIYASPILSAMIPVAVGAAMSFKMEMSKRVAVSVFGDAAIEEGAFAESVNFAVTNVLPVLFICENNLYSTHTPLSVRQPPSKIAERVAIAEMKAVQLDGNDACLLYEKISEALAGLRQGKGPLFIECLTYRVREHVGPLFDYERGYRSKEEVDSWMSRCPISFLAEKMLSDKMITEDQYKNMCYEWQSKANSAYDKALKSPWPNPQSIQEHVY